MAKFTIKVTATLNGKSCKNPQVEFIQGENFLYPCEIKDGEITFEIKPGTNPNACIEGYIKCEDECLNCPPQYFKKCLCNDITLLEPCQKCVDGFIVDSCTAEQTAMGMICAPGGCQCPPTAPIKDPTTGQCVQCITGAVSGCKVCVAGHWEDIVCPEGESCQNGACTCPAGKVRDPFTGLCVVAPICDEDSDCGLCEMCVLGNCVPLVCPENYKCVDGECVYWPCSNSSCSNGADCGLECGCLDGECVPCYILECQGECVNALGCKCNPSIDKCGPVDNCGQYCDGSTPCLDENCTCYNNRCVSCENFPCLEEGGCDSYYNCGCTNGECGGGKGCNDKIELKKEESCSNPDGCSLTATYTTENSCGCDPIEVRVSNIKSCSLTSSRTSDVLLNLKVELFKNNIPYADYRNQLSIGDDELIEGTISTTIKHFVQNESGLWVETNAAGVMPPPTLSVVGNAIDLLSITNTMVRDNINLSPTKVVVELRANGFKIPENDCTAYDTNVIASYELDFLAYDATCAKINGVYKTPVSTLLTDNDSTRRPLFIWSKSTTSTFANTQFIANSVYNTSGWFRKEYGTKSGNVWTDKIKDLADGLTNNYNYKVTTDCGCKATDATLQKVVFCCPTEYQYTIANCGRKITVSPFDTCTINRRLIGNLIQEVQTYYYLIINGDTEKLLRSDGGNLLNQYTYEHTEPITSVVFEQRYTGAPIVEKACEVTYTETPNLPDFTATSECGKITITKLAGTAPITGVNVAGETFAFAASNNSTVWTATVPKVAATYKVNVVFQGSCIATKDVQVVCEPVIEATPTSIVAKGDCPGGVNPDITVKVVSGFTAAAEFQDPKTGLWLAAQTTTPDITRTFLNFPAGTHVFNVREAGKASATVSVTIKPVIVPTVTSTNICGTTLGGITLTNVKDTVWKVMGPSYPGNGSNFNSINEGRVSIPINLIGTYFVELVSSTEGATCQQTIEVEITNEGGTITPTIQTSISSICQGGEIQFKIEDGGENLTYLVSASGGQIQNIDTGAPIAEVTASNNGPYNAKIKVLSSGAVQINITAIKNNNGCYTLIPVTKTVTGIVGPIIAETDAVCSGIQTYDAFVIITGTATSVTVNGFPATQVGNTWWAYGLTYTGSSNPVATVIATNGTCTTQSSFIVPTLCTEENFCPQPPQTIQIAANPESPTCGQQNVDIDFQYSTLGDLTGSTYGWYEVLSGNNDTLASTSFANPGTISGAIPTLQVSSNTPGRYYRLKITTQGVCEFVSNTVEVISGASLNPTISGTTSGVLTTGSYNYFTATVPDATYEWTLTNINGTNQPIGTNSANVTITNFAAGSNTITVTVTTPNCTGTASLIVSTTLNCNKSIGIQPTVGSGSNGCKNLSGLVTSNPNGSSITSSRWLINDVETLVTVGSIANLNMSTIDPGDVVDVRLEVTFADGCVIAAPVYEYTRCGCICDATSICTEIVTSMADLTQAIAATEDMYILFPITDNPHRLVITKGMTTLVDTLQFINNATFLPFDEGSFVYRSPLLVSVAPGGNIGALNVLNYVDCTLAVANPDINPTVAVGVTAIRSTAATAIYIKVPAAVHLGDPIAIDIIAGIDDSPCDPLLSAAPPTITVSCNPIAGAGTI